MANEQTQTGKERVREIFVQRLKEAGVQRPRSMTVANEEALHKRLVDHLSYMDAGNLELLAEMVLDAAVDTKGGCLPAEVVIRQMAKTLQAPPKSEPRIATSWLGSVKGPEALAGGYAVELFRWLRANGRPPMNYDMRKIREEAASNKRQREMIAENHRVGRASADELEWSEDYERDLARVTALVEEGRAGRAA